MGTMHGISSAMDGSKAVLFMSMIQLLLFVDMVHMILFNQLMQSNVTASCTAVLVLAISRSISQHLRDVFRGLFYTTIVFD